MNCSCEYYLSFKTSNDEHYWNPTSLEEQKQFTHSLILEQLTTLEHRSELQSSYGFNQRAL